MDIKANLQDVFRDVFDDEGIEIFEAMTAADIEEWDSLNHVQLIFAVETKFKVKFNTAEMTNSKNVGELIELLKRKLVV